MNTEEISDKFTCLGYYSNFFAREVGSCLEEATRPFSIYQDTTKRVYLFTKAFFYIPLCIATTPISMIFYSIALIFQKQRLRIEKYEKSSVFKDKNITLASINLCLQEGPFAPLTGGVTRPNEYFSKNYKNRVNAIANFALNDLNSPDILCFQEVHGLDALNNLKDELRNVGYSTFIFDLAPHPIFMNSGLFVAMKPNINFSNVNFIEFPIKDRYGITLGAQQGCISFSIETFNSHINIFTTHLAYGDNGQNTRQRQLNRIFSNFDNSSKNILVGDFNFNVDTHHLLFEDYYDPYYDKNIKSTRLQTQPHLRDKIETREERIDTAITTLKNDQIKAEVLDPEVDNKSITDHAALLLTINP